MMEQLSSMKGAAGYIGASRLFYACDIMKTYYKMGNEAKMLESYPGVIEAVIEFKVYSRQVICANQNKIYVLRP